MNDSKDVYLKQLVKQYGDTIAVNGINLEIPAGSYCCLVGPSGCGKTSTLRMISGHEDVTEGSITIGSQEVNQVPPAQRGTAMMFQNYALFPHMTVQENLAFPLEVRKISKQDTKEKVVGAYYAYLILEENKTLLNNSLINLNAIQKETEILVSEGLFEQINLDQINYSVLKLNNQISQIDHQATNSINILKFVIGFPQDSSLTLSNSLTDFNAENVSLDQFQISPSQMLDYQIVDENRKLSLLTLKMNKVSAIPSVSGFFSHQQTALRNEFNLLSADKPWYPSTFWGININIPIFTSGESLAVTKQSELAFKKSENLLLSVEQGLKQQLSQLYTEYNLALYALENDKENLILSQKILSNTLTRFKEGLKSGLEVAQAQNQEISAQNQLLQSHFNLLLAKLKLDKLMNKH